MKAIKERIYKIEQEQSDFENNVNMFVMINV